MTLTWPLAAPLAAAGLVVGSYAVTVGIRFTRGEASVLGRSHCDACAAPLGFVQTLPVVSYVGLGGACRRCGARIDPLHPLGEVAGGAVMLSAVWAADPLRAGLMAMLGLALVAAVAADIRAQRLPDPFTLVVAVGAGGLAASAGLERLGQGVAASAISAGLLLGVRALTRRREGEPGLGLGDVKLIAALALWLGAATPWMVVIAAALGLAVAPWSRRRDRRIAFGPMIAAGAWIVGVALERRSLGAWL